MAQLSSLPFHSLTSQHGIVTINGIGIELTTLLSSNVGRLKFIPKNCGRKSLVLTASAQTSSVPVNGPNSQPKHGFNLDKSMLQFQQLVSSLPSLVVVIRRQPGANLILGFCIATVCLFIAVRIYVVRSLRDRRPGTVADLVRRGQLRSDRRGISKPLKYEDPFNNPLVKVGKGNSTVEMCGKVYRLAPVTLTEDERAIHQKRRSRAYEWKRPKVFLKEGDSIPPDVDPDTVRWIPANHPFATTASDIDEELAQNNVYQKNGVPFRIKAEHEALQRKLEALQNEQKLNKLTIDHGDAKDFERAFKTQMTSQERAENNTHNSQVSDFKPPKIDQIVDNNNATDVEL